MEVVDTQRMIIVMILTRAKLYWTILLAPIPALYLLAFCCGLGMALATMQVFFRDTGHLYSIVTLVWMYLTPLFYPTELLRENGLSILLEVNPLYHYISYFRMLVLEGQVPGLYENMPEILSSCSFVSSGKYKSLFDDITKASYGNGVPPPYS